MNWPTQGLDIIFRCGWRHTRVELLDSDAGDLDETCQKNTADPLSGRVAGAAVACGRSPPAPATRPFTNADASFVAPAGRLVKEAHISADDMIPMMTAPP